MRFRTFIASILALSFVLMAPVFVQAQSKSQLKAKQKNIKKELKEQEEILNQTKKEKKVSLTQLAILKKQIQVREKLIGNVKAQIRMLNGEIEAKQLSIQSIEADLVLLKQEYADMLFQAYKHRSSYDKLMYMFAAENFNQAWKRLAYYDQYAAYRKRQADLIVETQQTLELELQLLEDARTEKQALLGTEKNEKEALLADQNQQQKVVRNLQSKEAQIKKDIKKKQAEYNQLQAAIQRIIEDEIRRERELAKKNGTNFFTNRPEYKTQSKNFAGNKGKLPWPVEKGDISTGFGRQKFKEVAGVEINNNGVEISTLRGSFARAVFKGKVSGVVVIPGMGKAVIVRHGSYLTVYSKLQETMVQTGDEVKEGQKIGTIATDDASGVAELHFEIRNEQTPLDPSKWLHSGK